MKKFKTSKLKDLNTSPSTIMTIAPKNLTCSGYDEQDVQEVKNYGGWITLKKVRHY
jgi:hypothetical protein